MDKLKNRMKKYLLISILTLLSYAGFCQVIAVNDVANCYAICNDGRVIIWGNNVFGTLGNGTTGPQSVVPIYVSLLTQVKALGFGDDNCLALKSDSTVWAWGSNYYGSLGLCDNIDRNVPTQITSLNGITSISGGDNYAYAIKYDGTLWAWGWSYGNCPIQITLINDIKKIQAGGCTTVLKNDGTVWTWGSNSYGQLGNGTLSYSATPVQVLGLSGVVDISDGSETCYALKSDGTVWAWGRNWEGQVGDGTYINRTLPVQVIGLTDVIDISSGMETGFALKNDSTVWAWGRNSEGEVGDGTLTTTALPVQVAGLSQITEVTEGNTVLSMALKIDGSLWTWGAWSYPGNGSTYGINATPVQANYLCTVTAPSTLPPPLIEPICDQSSFIIYPNPSSGEFSITTSGCKSEEIKIFNALGQLVKEVELINTTQCEVDMMGIVKGIYFVHITEDQKDVRNAKIIIQ